MENKILFRCSGTGALMTDPKLKADKDAGNLSETAKTFVEDKWLFDTFGFAESIKNQYMDKGNECEQDSMDLVTQVLEGGFRSRYNTKLQNDYVIGTPDIVLADCVEDIKTSWNLKTFFNAELSKMYFAQAQCYMWLTGKEKYRLIYALVPTPQSMVLNECEKLVYKYGKNYDNEDYIAECQQIFDSWSEAMQNQIFNRHLQNMTSGKANCMSLNECEKLVYKYGKNYDNEDYIAECQQIQRNNDLIKELPIEKRVKVFAFDYDPNYIETLKIKIEKAREYYNTLKL